MHESKTIQLLNKYYDLLSADRELSHEEKSIVRFIEFDLAKSVVEEFSEDAAYRISEMIRVYLSTRS